MLDTEVESTIFIWYYHGQNHNSGCLLAQPCIKKLFTRRTKQIILKNNLTGTAVHK